MSAARPPIESRSAETVRMVPRPATNAFPAVGLPPERPMDGIHAFYLRIEPALQDAIERGDRREARRLINHLLVHIYALGQERGDVFKGLLLELVVMLSRRAIEGGASPSEMWGRGFAHISRLSSMDDDEALAAWLRDMLERIFDAAENPAPPRASVAVERAMAFMRAHIGEDLSRDDVARAVGVSPGHLTGLLKEVTGRAFGDILREMRVEAACRMLADPRHTLADIAFTCGFCDQSYFTRVFKEARGTTPKQYREGADGRG